MGNRLIKDVKKMILKDLMNLIKTNNQTNMIILFQVITRLKATSLLRVSTCF